MQAANDQASQRYRSRTRGEPKPPEEAIVLDIIRKEIEAPLEDDYSVTDSIVSLGAIFMDLVAIMQHVNKHGEFRG